MPDTSSIELRAARHGALGDPARLRIVEALRCCDRSPLELRRLLGLESNLMAHHLDVLEAVGLIERSRSSGDGRRRYVHLRNRSLEDLITAAVSPVDAPLFVCTANSARSQLAEALWRSITGGDCGSAGTNPADSVHVGALRAADRAGLDLAGASPRLLSSIGTLPELVITVCDRAHEELEPGPSWLHWSIPDPVTEGSSAAFDSVVAELSDRIRLLRDTTSPMEAIR